MEGPGSNRINAFHSTSESAGLVNVLSIDTFSGVIITRGNRSSQLLMLFLSFVCCSPNVVIHETRKEGAAHRASSRHQTLSNAFYDTIHANPDTIFDHLPETPLYTSEAVI